MSKVKEEEEEEKEEEEAEEEKEEEEGEEETYLFGKRKTFAALAETESLSWLWSRTETSALVEESDCPGVRRTSELFAFAVRLQ